MNAEPGSEGRGMHRASGIREVAYFDCAGDGQVVVENGFAHFVPDVPGGAPRVSSNDVFVDANGLIYRIDRIRGLHVLERV